MSHRKLVQLETTLGTLEETKGPLDPNSLKKTFPGVDAPLVMDEQHNQRAPRFNNAPPPPVLSSVNSALQTRSNTCRKITFRASAAKSNDNLFRLFHLLVSRANEQIIYFEKTHHCNLANYSLTAATQANYRVEKNQIFPAILSGQVSSPPPAACHYF